MGETKRREIRVDDDLWNAAIAKAHAEGVTVSGLVRTWLADYIVDDQPALSELSRIIVRLRDVQKQLAVKKTPAAPCTPKATSAVED